MPPYELTWDDSRTARVRPADALSLLPLAWLRVEYSGVGHLVERVDVYSHATTVANRVWRGNARSVVEAVSFCEEHRRSLEVAAGEQLLPESIGRPPRHPWAYATMVEVP